MTVQHFCPECLELRNFKEVYEDETFNVKGEKINIRSRYLECEECAEVISDPENPDENFIKAYDEYRSRKNLLQPSEIKKIREMYGLSQRTLSKILGWSHVTLSRYETGAIQSVSHNNELILIRENPFNLLLLLRTNKNSLSPSEFKKIEELLLNAISEQSVTVQSDDNVLTIPKKLYQELLNKANDDKSDVNDELIYLLTKSLTENNMNNTQELILSKIEELLNLNTRIEAHEDSYYEDEIVAALDKNLRGKKPEHRFEDYFRELEENLRYRQNTDHSPNRLASLFQKSNILISKLMEV